MRDFRNRCLRLPSLPGSGVPSLRSRQTEHPRNPGMMSEHFPGTPCLCTSLGVRGKASAKFFLCLEGGHIQESYLGSYSVCYVAWSLNNIIRPECVCMFVVCLCLQVDWYMYTHIHILGTRIPSTNTNPTLSSMLYQTFTSLSLLKPGVPQPPVNQFLCPVFAIYEYCSSSVPSFKCILIKLAQVKWYRRTICL